MTNVAAAVKKSGTWQSLYLLLSKHLYSVLSFLYVNAARILIKDLGYIIPGKDVSYIII